MLSPEINFSNGLLTNAFNEIVGLDNYSNSVITMVIGKLEKDPSWLVSVRNRIRLLADVGKKWFLKKPDYWSQILVQFQNYTSNFESVAKLISKGDLKTDQYVSLLENMLLNSLKDVIAQTRDAANNINSFHSEYQSIQPLLEKSINEGWKSLAREEQKMVDIAAEMAALQQLVTSLESKITSGVISGNKSIITSSVSTIYKVVTTTGTSFSFLSMITSAITVGKMYYDIIAGTESVEKTLNKIAKLQLEASAEAQAAAGTKIAIQVLYNLEKSFLSMQQVMNELVTMWTTEKNKIVSVINALESGVDPRIYFDLLTINTANKNWQSINGFAQKVLTTNLVSGKPVILNPQSGKVITNT